ncbi:MAG: type II toxin-antitoxin system PemK/MazF family toxin [Candidatus Dormiibacterota bacterium]
MLGRPGLRWAILIVNFDPIEEHDQGGSRRALVVSYEPLRALGMMSMCPITGSHSQPRNPLEIPIRAGQAGQTKDGLILVHQVRSVSILRAAGTLGADAQVGTLIDPDLRTRLRLALAIQFGLDVPGSEDGALTNDHYGASVM